MEIISGSDLLTQVVVCSILLTARYREGSERLRIIERTTMSMLIISEDEFLNELKQEKSESIQRGEAIRLENGTYDNFRKPAGIPNLPIELKSIVSVLGETEKYEDVAEAFQVSKDTVGNLTNNEHSNELVKERKANTIERIKEETATKIESCIKFLEVSKEMNNKELLNTAESLSRVHRNISGNTSDGGNNVQFIYYAPERQNKVDDYPIIDANV